MQDPSPFPQPIPDNILVYTKQDGKMQKYNVANAGSYEDAIRLVQESLMQDSLPYIGSVLALAKG